MRVKGRINMAKYGVPRLLLGRSFALLGLSSSWQKHIHRFETPARCKRSLLSRLFVSTCPCAGCEGASALRSRPRESHFVSKRQQRLEPSIYPRGGQGKASQSSSHGVRERGGSMAWQHMAGFRWRLSLQPFRGSCLYMCGGEGGRAYLAAGVPSRTLSLLIRGCLCVMLCYSAARCRCKKTTMLI